MDAADAVGGSGDVKTIISPNTSFGDIMRPKALGGWEN